MVSPSVEGGSEVGGSLLVQSTPRYVRFGPFQVDQLRQEVTQNGSRLKLQGKVFQVLIALLEKPGEVVTREELRQRLWPADSQVNYDANVNTTVNKLRQSLGDSSDKPLYVETIPRKGYCFVAQPEYSEQPMSPVAAPPLPAETASSMEEVAELQEASGAVESAPKRADSNFWVTMGMIGLVLAGMVLGACIATIWNAHMVPVNLWP